MRRVLLLVVAVVTAVVFPGKPAVAVPYPDEIPLPDGIYPEGIEVGRGHDFYVGSLLDGAVYAGDLRTGDVITLAEGATGRFVAGLSFDARSGLLWGVGGDTGGNKAFAFDTITGAVVHVIPIEQGAFINDVVVTRDALYITDSLANVLWVVPLTNRGAPAGEEEALELTGDFELVTEGQLPVNLNGIAATPDGGTLVAVHTTLGVLYRIDPATGEATEIDLAGDGVPSGDGIVLHGRTLYVVQNFLNQVAVVELDPGFTTGQVTETITSDLFRVPATAARFGASLYLVNARFDEAFPPIFGVPPADPPLDYDVVKVPLH